MESIFDVIGGILYFAFIILSIAGLWKMFTKAGQPGFAAIIPIYNIYIMTKIAEKPGWFVLLFFIPLANIYAYVVIMNGISTKFGKGTGFTLGLIFLGFIFFPILGFGDAQYEGYEPSIYGDVLDDNM